MTILIVRDYKLRHDVIPFDAKEKVVGNEREKAIKNILESLEHIRQNNGYIRLIDGEDSYEIYVFNSHGEAIAQGSKYNYITVFKNDNTSVRYTDVVDIGPDIDIVKLMERSLELLDLKKAQLSKPINLLDGIEGIQTYYVQIQGWNNIRALYEDIDNEFADVMIENMKESVGGSKYIEVSFKYLLGENKEFSVACEIALKDEEFTVWYFDGYVLLSDWKLGNEWYAEDFKDGQEVDIILSKLLGELDEMFNKYIEDNNLQIEVEEDDMIDNGNDMSNEDIDDSSEKVEETIDMGSIEDEEDIGDVDECE